MILFVDLLKNEIKLVLLDCQATKKRKCLLIHLITKTNQYLPIGRTINPKPTIDFS
jgi:hypothetical protein